MLSGLKEFSEAFFKDQKLEGELQSNLELLQTLEKNDANLGFWKQKSDTNDLINTAKRILVENGKNVSTDDAIKLTKQLSKLEQLKQTRRKFWVQVMLTVVICIAIGLLLGGIFGESDSANNSAYGLMGSLVGYWLK